MFISFVRGVFGKGGFCPGGFCPGVYVRGVFVLIPLDLAGVRYIPCSIQPTVFFISPYANECSTLKTNKFIGLHLPGMQIEVHQGVTVQSHI